MLCIKCDRCNTIFNDNELNKIIIKGKCQDEEIDLCDKCSDEFYIEFKSFIRQVEQDRIITERIIFNEIRKKEKITKKELIEVLKSYKIEKFEEVLVIINKLKKRGEVYEPRPDTYRATMRE